MWFRRPRPPSDDVPGLLGFVLSEESEAFLAGQMVEHARGQGRRLGPWALLNGVAHASLEEVEGIACDESRPSVERDLAVATLAATGGSREELSRVQRDHLVPLELSLVGQVVSSRAVLELASRALFMTS
jgi:hypothetical protein